MIYKKYKSGAFNIYTIKTDKFKNCQIEIMFRDQLKKDEITKRIMLCDLLCESSFDYSNSKEFYKVKENLYNTLLYSSTTRIGESITSNFVIDFIDPNYADDNFLESIITLLCNTIQKPNVKDNAFDKKSFTTVYNQIKTAMELDNEKSANYAVKQMLKNMDAKAPACININGYVNDLKKITPENLYDYHQEFINHNYCDIFVIGNLDMDRVVSLINKHFNIKTIKNHPLNISYEPKKRMMIKSAKDVTKFKQSILVVGCNVSNLTEKEKNITMFLYNSILGLNSIGSKLGNNLRQKNSLCYSVSSFYQKYDNMLIIRTAFKENNYNLAVKLIKKSINEMKKGLISDEEFNNAKSSIILGLTLSKDDPSELINNYIMQELDNLPNLDDRIKMFKNVTKQEVIDVAKKIKINTIYLLSVGGE